MNAPNVEAFLDMITPALEKLEKSCPPPKDIPDPTLPAAAPTLAGDLDQWCDWALRLEEFFWDYGSQVLGSSSWIPATDSVQDYKVRIRRIRDALRRNDVGSLKSLGLVDEAASTLKVDALRSVLLDGGVLGLLGEAREFVDAMNSRPSSTMLTLTESPPSESALDDSEDL